MGLDVTCIENALVAWVKKATCLKQVIQAHPNAPRPKGQYAMVHLVSDTVLGHCEPEYSAVDPVPPETIRSIKAEYSNVYNLMVSINFYRDNAHQLAIKLRDSVCLITIKDELWKAGLAFVTTSDVREIPEVIDKRWEERAQIDFFFYVRSEESETINEIKEVELTNEIDGSTTTIP